MLVIYDTEDCNPSPNPPVFLQREVALMIYVRTDIFDKTIMQKWVRKDGMPTKNGKNWVYNHYVPHSRIQKAIENFVITNNMTREDAIEWLVNITVELGIKPDEQLAEIDWKISRVTYDLWVDWAVSAICDWKSNIFFGPGTGDHRGTALDKPDDIDQFHRVEKAAAKLAKLIPAEPSLSVDKISPEELVGNEEADSFVRDAQAAAEVSAMWRQFFKDGKLLEEDASDESWEKDKSNLEESDPEEMYNLQNRNWKRGERLSPLRNVHFKRNSSISSYQQSMVAFEKRKKSKKERKEEKEKKEKKNQMSQI